MNRLRRSPGSRAESKSGSGLARRALAALLVLGLVAVGGFGIYELTRTNPVKVSAMFTQAVGLYPGSDVRVLGLPIGTVTKVTPEGTLVRVDMEVDPDQKIAASSGAAIVSPTLVSDRYVQFTEPWTDGAVLSTGTTIAEDNTAVPVEIDELSTSLTDLTTALGPDGANSDGSLSKLVSVGADNFDGNGQKLRTLISEFGKATGTLSNSDEDLFATVANLDKFSQTLADNDRGVAQVDSQLSDVTGYLADDRQDLATAIDNLGQALGVVDNFIRDNRKNLTASVKGLVGPTRTLVRQKDSLEETVRILPVALQNFLRAYDPTSGTLIGRPNLNELTVWAGGGAGALSATPAEPTGGSVKDTNGTGESGLPSIARSTTNDTPPVLLPGLGQ